MTRKLTEIERKRVRGVLDGKLDYHELRTAEEWHQLALHWNWDDGIEPLTWIATQPQCDRGTALCIYWHGAPWRYRQFADRDEIEEAGENLDLYDFLKSTEVRYLRGFYRNGEIGFDPRHAETANGQVQDLTLPDPDIVYQRQLPQPMLEASPGEPAAREDLTTVTVRLPYTREHRELVGHLSRGAQELLTFQPSLAKDASPAEIVDAICGAVDGHRSGLAATDVVPDGAPIMELGYLWADQLRRAYGWEWQAWDYETGATVALFALNRQYGCFAPNFVKYVLHERGTPTTIIRSLFDQLARPDSAPDLAEACERGWMMENPFYN